MQFDSISRTQNVVGNAGLWLAYRLDLNSFSNCTPVCHTPGTQPKPIFLTSIFLLSFLKNKFASVFDLVCHLFRCNSTNCGQWEQRDMAIINKSGFLSFFRPYIIFHISYYYFSKFFKSRLITESAGKTFTWLYALCFHCEIIKDDDSF